MDPPEEVEPTPVEDFSKPAVDAWGTSWNDTPKGHDGWSQPSNNVEWSMSASVSTSESIPDSSYELEPGSSPSLAFPSIQEAKAEPKWQWGDPWDQDEPPNMSTAIITATDDQSLPAKPNTDQWQVAGTLKRKPTKNQKGAPQSNDKAFAGQSINSTRRGLTSEQRFSLSLGPNDGRTVRNTSQTGGGGRGKGKGREQRSESPPVAKPIASHVENGAWTGWTDPVDHSGWGLTPSQVGDPIQSTDNDSGWGVNMSTSTNGDGSSWEPSEPSRSSAVASTSTATTSRGGSKANEDLSRSARGRGRGRGRGYERQKDGGSWQETSWTQVGETTSSERLPSIGKDDGINGWDAPVDHSGWGLPAEGATNHVHDPPAEGEDGTGAWNVVRSWRTTNQNTRQSPNSRGNSNTGRGSRRASSQTSRGGNRGRGRGNKTRESSEDVEWTMNNGRHSQS